MKHIVHVVKTPPALLKWYLFDWMYSEFRLEVVHVLHTYSYKQWSSSQTRNFEFIKQENKFQGVEMLTSEGLFYGSK